MTRRAAHRLSHCCGAVEYNTMRRIDLNCSGDPSFTRKLLPLLLPLCSRAIFGSQSRARAISQNWKLTLPPLRSPRRRSPRAGFALMRLHARSHPGEGCRAGVFMREIKLSIEGCGGRVGADGWVIIRWDFSRWGIDGAGDSGCLIFEMGVCAWVIPRRANGPKNRNGKNFGGMLDPTFKLSEQKFQAARRHV